MKAGDTHERWHPGESDDYLRAAIARVNGGDMSGLRDEVLRTVKWGGRDPEGAADAILALLVERLTSDDVVRELGMSVAYDTLQIVENRAPFSLGSEVYTENGKRYITTALIAAGIQKGEDDR